MRNLTFSSILLILLGLLLIAGGGWNIYKYRDYTAATGFILLGIGTIFFGITNGFSDITPTGRVLMKAGITLLIGGILLVGYVLSKGILN